MSLRAHGDARALMATLATHEALQPQQANQEVRHRGDTSQGPFHSPQTESSILHSDNTSTPSSYQAQHVDHHLHFTPGSQHVSRGPSMPHPLINHNSSHLHAATAASLCSGSASTYNWESSSATEVCQQSRHLRFEPNGVDTQATDDDAHMSVSEVSLRGVDPERISSSSRASSLGGTVKRQKVRDARFIIASSSKGRRSSEADSLVGANRKLKQRATKVSYLRGSPLKAPCPTLDPPSPFRSWSNRHVTNVETRSANA